MSVRPEERRTAREYNRLARRNSVRGTLARLLGDLPTYLFNTPALVVPGEFGLGPNHHVLELGSGRAGVAKLLARRARLRTPPVAFDISTEVLRRAAADSGREPAVQFVAGAASRLPFADESFHLVVAAHLFRQLEDDTLYRVLDDVLRILVPGGILLAWEYAPTTSERLNALHRRWLGEEVFTTNLRGFAHLAPYAVHVGYKHIDRMRLRLPFLFPPIPRVVVMLQKVRTPVVPDWPPALAVPNGCVSE
jgi:SAM-dependent methyltransferase